MKKLMIFSMVFALAAGGIFAIDVGIDVFGHIKVIEGSNDRIVNDDDKEAGDHVYISGGMDRLRMEGSGGNDTFGAWLRYDKDRLLADQDGDHGFGFEGFAWWQPIEQLKFTAGGNSDGIYGKEGYAGWMFYQMPSDASIVNPGNVWGGGYMPGWLYLFRNAFYGGFGDYGLLVDFKPIDLLGINIVLPFMKYNGTESKEFLKKIHAQLDFNFDFGNIALTYRGEPEYYTNGDAGTFYGYFNLTAVENVSMDLGLGFELADKDSDEKKPTYVGFATKYDVNDAFGFKLRTMVGFGGQATAPFVLGLDLLPYYGINDSIKIFLDLGMTMFASDDKEVDTDIGWHVNPYVQIGSEWGPSFYAGFRIWSSGAKELTQYDQAKNSDKRPDFVKIEFELPVGMQVSY